MSDELHTEQAPRKNPKKKTGLTIALVAISVVLVATLIAFAFALGAGWNPVRQDLPEANTAAHAEDRTEEHEELRTTAPAAEETPVTDVPVPQDAVIGVLMPNDTQYFWAIQGACMDESFRAAGYETLLAYAEDDYEKQIEQINNMIAMGVNVLIVTPVDSAALTEACEVAKECGIPVIANDRLITNTEAVDYYVTFDMIQTGQLQGQYIVDALNLDNAKRPCNLEIFSGAQDDPNAKMFYDGAMDVLQPYIDAGKLVVQSGRMDFETTAIAGWDSARAQSRMDELLSAYYADERLDAVLAAADCLANGVIASVEQSGYGAKDKPFPVITGQDAELSAVKNIKSGKQSMTVFLDATIQTEAMVSLVQNVLAGREIAPDAAYYNGAKDIPTILYGPCVISADNLEYLVEIGWCTQKEINNP